MVNTLTIGAEIDKSYLLVFGAIMFSSGKFLYKLNEVAELEQRIVCRQVCMLDISKSTSLRFFNFDIIYQQLLCGVETNG